MERKILEVRGLKKYFPVKRRISDAVTGKPRPSVKAVDGVSLDIYKGESLGLVGESGCGKSTLARTVIRLYKPDEGEIIWSGYDLAQMPQKELREHRKKFQMIFQDPYSSLNPRMSVRNMLAEVLSFHNVCQKKEINGRILEIMEKVGLDPGAADRLPGEFSAGQRQRVGIARAIILNPELIIADEPVSALDVSIQAKIIRLLTELQESMSLTLLFISHDLRVVRNIAHRVAVMYLGRIVELAPAEELFRKPLHPYTEMLLSAELNLDPRERGKDSIKDVISSEPQSPIDLPSGCRFHPRCPRRTQSCEKKQPRLNEVERGHFVECLIMPFSS